MSLENAVLYNQDVIIGTDTNSLKNIFTDVINIDGFTIFRQSDNFFKRDEETGVISKLSTGNGQVYKWYRVKDNENLVYLQSDLIIDNNIHINGYTYSNYNIEHYKNNIDDSTIKFTGLGFGGVTNHSKDKEVTDSYIVVNDAWKSFNNNTELFSSKTLIIEGDLYLNNTLSTSLESNIKITYLKEKLYTAEQIINGTSQWAKIDDKIYVNKPIFIDGDIIVSGNIYNCNNYIDNTENNDIIYPENQVSIDTVTIKDNLKITKKNIFLENEKIEIKGEDIRLIGDKINIDGDVSFHFQYAHTLKEIYEHAVIYNQAGLMQKRTAFTGQVPIRYGNKHEIGYEFAWTGNATHFDIFKVTGDIFLADTNPNSGFRIITDFVLTINPVDDGEKYPAMDALFNINNRYNLGALKSLMDVDAKRISGKRMSLRMIWETLEDYKELYYASFDVTAVIPSKLGKNMMITPYYNVIRGDEIDAIPISSIKPFIKYDENSKSEGMCNLYYQNVDIANLKIVGDNMPNDRTSLQVYKTNTDTEYNIAEFWDKNNIIQDKELDCLHCFDTHYNDDNVYGVVIGRSGITVIGIHEKDKKLSLEYGHKNSNLAQLNINSENSSMDRLKVKGRYNQITKIDNDGNLILGSDNKYQVRNNITNPLIDEYKLDVNGDTTINGILLLKHNDILRTFFSVKHVETVVGTENVIELYVSWGINLEDSYDIYQPINLNIDYYISSIDIFPILTKQQTFSILINPRNDIGKNMPNIITILEKDGQTTSIYRSTTLESFRNSHNSIKILIRTIYATYDNEEFFKSIAYANISMIGESFMNEFLVTSKLDFYGLLVKPEVDDLKLTLRIGDFKLNLYQYSNINNILIATFHTKYANPSVVIDGLFLTISVDNTYNDFNIEVEILNRQNQNLGTLFTIYVNIFPTIVAMTNEYIVPDILIDLVKIDLLQFYNLNSLYIWDDIKDIIRFTSTHNVNHETGELELRGYQSGNQLYTEIGIYLLNNNNTQYIHMNSDLIIRYTEIKQIILNPEYEANIEIGDFNLIEYYDNPDTTRINFSNIEYPDIITDNYLTTYSWLIGKSLNIIAFYKDHYDTTFNNKLILNVVGSSGVFTETETGIETETETEI